MKLAIFLIIGVIIVLCLIFLLGPEFKRLYCYKFHKKRVSKLLYKLANDDDLFLLNDLETNNDVKLKIDHIYFGKKYVYCIKSVSFNYGIQGKKEDAKWFSYDKKNQFEYIENLLNENNKQINALMQVANTNEPSMFYSIICVNDDCYLDIEGTSSNQVVLHYKDLKRFIHSKEKDKSVKAINLDSLQKTVIYIYKNSNKNI